MADFNSTVQELTFPSDEGLPSLITDIPAPIPIIDDEINEGEQIFVAYLEIFGAVNYDLIESMRDVTMCIIVDNDSEFCVFFVLAQAFLIYAQVCNSVKEQELLPPDARATLYF